MTPASAARASSSSRASRSRSRRRALEQAARASKSSLTGHMFSPRSARPRRSARPGPPVGSARDRQGRAADPCPLAARAVRLQPGRAGRAWAWEACSWCRSAAGGSWAWWWAWPRRASCRPSAWPSRCARSRPRCPPRSVRLGLWLAREYCSAPARGLALVLPRERAPAAAARCARGASCAWSSPTPAATALRPRTPRGSARASSAALGRSLPGPVGAAAWARWRRAATTRTLRRLERRGLVELASALEATAGRGSSAVGAAARRRRSPRADQTAALDAVAARLDGRRRGPPLLLARRHRQRQDRGLPARGGGGAGARAARRSCWCPRSRSPRRPPGGSWSASATPWP